MTKRRWITATLHEPLLHFMLIGAAVFLLHRAVSPPPTLPQPAVIDIDQSQVDRLGAQFERVWRRPPTPDESKVLVEDFLREEVYYREALALGLDRDDAIIRRRLRQKMEFMSEAGAATLTPDEGTLRAHYARNATRFTAPARVTFRQILLGDADAQEALSALASGADPAALGQGTILPGEMELAAEPAVDGTFGQGFFASVSSRRPGGWQGPVVSAFGSHLVQLVASTSAEPAPFETIRDVVEDDWLREAAARLRDEQFLELRDRYRVTLPEAR